MEEEKEIEIKESEVPFLNERLPFGVAVSNAVCARLGIPVPDRSKNNDNL